MVHRPPLKMLSTRVECVPWTSIARGAKIGRCNAQSTTRGSECPWVARIQVEPPSCISSKRGLSPGAGQHTCRMWSSRARTMRDTSGKGAKPSGRIVRGPRCRKHAANDFDNLVLWTAPKGAELPPALPWRRRRSWPSPSFWTGYPPDDPPRPCSDVPFCGAISVRRLARPQLPPPPLLLLLPSFPPASPESTPAPPGAPAPPGRADIGGCNGRGAQ
mmetsp:Transcript_92283/g.265540  ORF Transcript_92283/g.265540 Transcript_92283/m.265540 type:complete len:217 (+) Transcript_92283:367-1017(+)